MLIYQYRIPLKAGLTEEMVKGLSNRHSLRDQHETSGRCFLADLQDSSLSLMLAAKPGADPDELLREHLDGLKIPYCKPNRKKLGIQEFVLAIMEATDKSFCSDPTRILTPLGFMPYLGMPFCQLIREVRIDKPSRQKERDNLKHLHSHSLNEELERIYEGKGRPFRGHPVLYAIAGSSSTDNENATDILLGALLEAGRLFTDYATVLKPNTDPIPECMVRDVYKANCGGSVLVDLEGFGLEEKSEECLEAIRECARSCRGEVLTVFYMAGENASSRKILESAAEGLPVLPIYEDGYSLPEAKRYLAAEARKAGLEKVPFEEVLPAGKAEFTRAELQDFFANWSDRYLCSQVYPQYAGVLNKPIPQEEKRSALQELDSLVGLKGVKRVLHQAVDFAKMQKSAEKLGLPAEAPHLHMVFTGNPGTAKTTAARLAARIFKECGVLSKGDLVEVGRGDLIGKYVGWTAKQVKDKFDEAEGSVLFIDEAYSLLDDREHQFGDEAINTIVQEMENRRDKTIVIFAGYRRPMEAFLRRNPGLRSRVNYILDFPDYNEEELYEIFRLNLRKKGRELTEEAEEKVRRILLLASEEEAFGNGRYARNLLDRAMMAQASRLAADPENVITAELLKTLTADDFVLPKGKKIERPRVIGFSA